MLLNDQSRNFFLYYNWWIIGILNSSNIAGVAGVVAGGVVVVVMTG